MLACCMQVESPHEWHRQNIAAHPSHYSFLRWLGANTVGQVQEKLGSGVYYNTLVTWDDRRIKYGVVSAARLRGDLRDWSDLYLAGRLHKPVITLKDDEEISVAKEANLGAALWCPLIRWDEIQLKVPMLTRVQQMVCERRCSCFQKSLARSSCFGQLPDFPTLAIGGCRLVKTQIKSKISWIQTWCATRFHDVLALDYVRLT